MSKSPFNGIWTKIDAFRPGLIRLLACDKRRGYSVALSDADIASRCNLPLNIIQWIQWEKTWDAVSYRDMKEFFKGCGFDLNNSKDVAYITKRLNGKSTFQFKWKHIMTSPHHRFFHKLLKHNCE